MTISLYVVLFEYIVVSYYKQIVGKQLHYNFEREVCAGGDNDNERKRGDKLGEGEIGWVVSVLVSEILMLRERYLQRCGISVIIYCQEEVSNFSLEV